MASSRRHARNTETAHPSPATGSSTHWAVLSALGVVFGDLGTSPLYTLQTIVQATGGQLHAAARSACCR